ncbi:predicted protein [Histoplasma mississippiense (nom. inval.)]|uniref:predicted protein n=1 Tax=Ajellomyces capsulatus (strain NAm1 / WU24) TaxID=2059318 RepID=UPI000157B937|nr:predicted protein [Histoplasma mississippiense (nom. inval.)]EDN03780.1 predicted protein [Histoplasma mississippiense (nom. inval.)]
MADITSTIPSNPGAGADSTPPAPPPPVPSGPGADSTPPGAPRRLPSAFASFMAHLFPPREGFDDDPLSVYHENDDDDDDDDDDVDVDEDEAMDVMRTLTLSIKDRLQLAKAIVDQAPENVHTVLAITAPQMTAEIYGKAIARAAAAVNPGKFHSEEDKQLGKNALEKLTHAVTWARQSLAGRWDPADVPVVEEPLDRYHRHCHIAATRHIITLYEACQAGHRSSITDAIRTTNYAGVSRDIANALSALHDINEKIMRHNIIQKNRRSTGKIRIQPFFDPWSSSESAKLRALCKSLRLPEGWAELPPVERYTYSEDLRMYWVPLWHQLTPLIMKLWDGIVKGASTEQLTPIHQEVTAKITELNSKISELNSQNEQPPQLHHINGSTISEAYFLLHTNVQNTGLFRETRAKVDSAFAELGYPETWTPRATTECLVCMEMIMTGITSYKQCPTCQVKIHTRCQSQWAQYYRDISGNSDFPCPHCRAMELNTTVSPPAQTTTQTATQISSLRNMGKRRVQIPPRKVSRCVRPGYTVHGQRISHINVYGNFAQVVVENEDGSRELLNATQAGGLAVVRAAESFPEVGKVESSGWKELRSKVSEMGEYGILWVAVSSHWDPTSERLPSVVCCFYHHVNGVYTEKVGSRSNIAKVLGKAGDLMIAEAISGKEDVESVEEAVEFIYCVTHEQREEYWDSPPRPSSSQAHSQER